MFLSDVWVVTQSVTYNDLALTFIIYIFLCNLLSHKLLLKRKKKKKVKME